MDIVYMDSTNTEPPSWMDATRNVLIVAAVDRSQTASRLNLLRDAGFPADRVDVLVVEEVPRLEERLGGSGLHQFLARLRLIRGDDLDRLEQGRRELMNGRALVWVTTTGYHEFRLAGSILGHLNIRANSGFEAAPIDLPWIGGWTGIAFPQAPRYGEPPAPAQIWA